jgi:hypothetical protein
MSAPPPKADILDFVQPRDQSASDHPPPRVNCSPAATLAMSASNGIRLQDREDAMIGWD